MDKTRAIGSNNIIPWHIPSDQKWFKHLTIGHAVIMGRITFESIGRPLPGRQLVVLTRSKSFQSEGVYTAKTSTEALKLAGNLSPRKIFIAGGEDIYREFMSQTDWIYLTQVHANFGGDRHFPEFEGPEFELQSTCHVEAELPYSHFSYNRVSSPGANKED